MSVQVYAVMDEAIAKIEELREERDAARREASDLRKALYGEAKVSASLLEALQSLVWAKDEAARYIGGAQMAAMILDS